MNGQLILKEWKEKVEILLFALAFLLIFVVAALVAAQRGDILDILTGSFLIVFLPVAAALIGASAFITEFKDGAWAYLLSRPLKKSAIWISKFAALLALVAALLAISFAVLSSIPSLSERIRELSLWGACFALSLSLFVIAFSLSFLTEKQFQVIFLSLLAFPGFGAVFAAVLKKFPNLIPDFVFLIPVVWVLGVVSIGASSLFAFCRTDFSQPRAKAVGFLKAIALSLVLGAVVVLASIWIAGRFTRTSNLWVEVHGRTAYIDSNRGLFRYDAERGKLKRLLGGGAYFGGRRNTAGGGKVVWFKESRVTKGPAHDLEQELWIMDEDGRNRKSLLRISEIKDPPLSGQALYDCRISPDGRRIICLPYGVEKDRPTLWSLNSDGTGLRFYQVDVPNADWFDCFGWSADGRHIILFVMEKQNPQEKRGLKRRARLFKLSLESGVWQAFPDSASGVWVFGLSPQGTRVGLLVSESTDFNAPRDVLALFDIESMEKTDILRVQGVQFLRWNEDGGKAAFLADNSKRIGVVSLQEKRILAEKVLSDKKKEQSRGTMDWAAEGQKLVLSDFDGSRYVLRVFSDTLQEDKAYPIPQGDTINSLPNVYGLGQKVLVLDFQSSRLWVFDLAKEKWRKLF